MATSLKGTLTQDQLKTSTVNQLINPATGQPYTAPQQAALQAQKDAITGAKTPQQLQAQREAATGAALKKSTTMNNYTSQQSADAQAQQALNTKYGLDPMAGLKGQAVNLMPNQTTPRDFEREIAMAKKLGISNPTPEQEKQLFQATYSPDELKGLGLDTYVAPSTPSAPSAPNGTPTVLPGGVPNANPASYLSPQQLQDMGLTDDVLNGLVAKGAVTQEQVNKMKETGMQMDQAQALLNATPKPTNATLGVLEQALKMKSGVGNQAIGQSDLFKAAGLNGYAVLAQNLAQRSNEMNQNYQSYANLVGTTASAQADVWSKALEGYKAAQDSWNQQSENLQKAHDKITDWEHSLELMKKQDEMERSRLEFSAALSHKYDSENYTSKELSNGHVVFFDREGNIKKEYDENGDLIGGDGYGGDTSAYQYPDAQPGQTIINIGGQYGTVNNKEFDNLFGVGSYGGQCGTWASTISTAEKVGNTWTEKKSHIQVRGQDVLAGEMPQAGYKLLLPLGISTDESPGHVEVVTSYNPQTGDIYTVEANRGLDGVIHRGKENINDLIKKYGDNFGFVKGELKSKYSQGITKQMETVGSTLKDTIQAQYKLAQKKNKTQTDLEALKDLGIGIAGIGSTSSALEKESKYTYQLQQPSSENKIDESVAVSDGLSALASSASSKFSYEAVSGSVQKYLEKGETEKAKNLILTTAANSLDATSMQDFKGSDLTLKLLDSIQGDLDYLAKKGVNTGFLKGKETDVLRNIGETQDPEVAKVQSKILSAVQRYRKAITGAGFAESETAEYNKIFPGIGNSKELNTANIEALREVLNANIDTYYGQVLGEDVYNNLVGKNNSGTDNEMASSGQVLAKAPDGNTYSIDASDMAAARKEGWTILN